MADDDPTPEADVAGPHPPRADSAPVDDDEAREDADDLRIGLERLELMKTEGTVSWESVKAKYGL